MPWHRLIDWFTGKRPAPLGSPMPMTLVTLSAVTPMAIDEFEFYGEAEYAALLEWARMGRFILALSATERDELTLLCVQTPEEMRFEVEMLPLVAAGLARFDIRVVMPLRLTNPSSGTLQ